MEKIFICVTNVTLKNISRTPIIIEKVFGSKLTYCLKYVTKRLLNICTLFSSPFTSFCSSVSQIMTFSNPLFQGQGLNSGNPTELKVENGFFSLSYVKPFHMNVDNGFLKLSLTKKLVAPSNSMKEVLRLLLLA